MTSNEPKLSVIGAAPTGESAESESRRRAEPASPPAARESPQKRLLWLLAALLLAVSAFLIAQVQQVRDLDRKVQSLGVELSAARRDALAHREHLRAVQSEVGAVHAVASELERRLAELDVLAGRNPLETR